jgi:hypothetical protein
MGFMCLRAAPRSCPDRLRLVWLQSRRRAGHARTSPSRIAGTGGNYGYRPRRLSQRKKRAEIGKSLGIRSNREYVSPPYSSPFQSGPVTDLVEVIPNLAVWALRMIGDSRTGRYSVGFLHVNLGKSANHGDSYTSRRLALRSIIHRR